MRPLLPLVIVLLVTASTLAGESVSFRTMDEEGSVFTGVVVELKSEGVLFETEQATTVVKWELIHPADRYRLRASVAPEEDAAARLELAETCLREAYFEGARRELEKALALGHRDSKKIQGMMDVADQRECEGMYARYRDALDKQAYDEAIEVVRRMAMRFPGRRLTAEARKAAPKILRARDAAKAQAEKDAVDAAAAAKEARRRAWIDARFEEAAKAVAKGKDAMVVARHYDAKGNLTRSRKGYEAAERSFLIARRALLRVRRVTRSGEDFDRAEREVRSVERRLLEVYVSLARMYVENGNYKSAVIYVDRALLFDPVNPEALRLAEEIRKNRIHRSLRRLTNSPGVITR